MESLPRKCKGARSACSLVGSLHDPPPPARKHNYREPKPRPEKKMPSSGGGNAADDASARGGVVTTALLASRRGAPESPGRGLKRKLGCIESATWIGRKRWHESEYKLGGEIGEGNFGSIRICRAKAEGEQFTCKALPKNSEETVHREVEIMQHLSGHPGIITLKVVFEDADKFYLIMELCSGCGLLDEMAREGRFSEQHTAIVIRDLMAMVKYCHEMGVVHRDIKSENILLTKAGKMKLADFGLSIRVTNGMSKFQFTHSVSVMHGEKLLLLAAGAKGNHAALPSWAIMIKQPVGRFQGQQTDVDIARKEIRNVKMEMASLHRGRGSQGKRSRCDVY